MDIKDVNLLLGLLLSITILALVVVSILSHSRIAALEIELLGCQNEVEALEHQIEVDREMYTRILKDYKEGW